MKKAALILSAAICALMISARAADWTDANNVTYTALKSINGGGSGYIATDFTPAGTDTVKFKFKPSTVSGNDCIYCSRYINGSGYATQQFCCFRISSVFRIDSHDLTKSYKRQYTCKTTLTAGTEYTLSADYYNAVVTINGTKQILTTSPASDKMAASSSSPFDPGSILVLLASHNSSSANAASADTLTGIGNKATCDLYYFQLWSYEGALSHNFMPAMRDSDSAVGLYDTVTQKFYPATDGSLTGAAYDASERAGKKWTGAGGDNKMSTAANWENNDKPAVGDDVDFTLAAPFAAIVADIDATFGKIYLGAGDLPAFSGTLTATAINDLTRMQDYDTATDGFTFSLEAPVGQDFTWNGGTAANWNTTDALWLYNSAASVWYEYNNAIFSTAGATATLTEDAKANSLVFNQNATIDGSSTLTVPTVSVDPNVSATISAHTDGALEKTGAGMLTLGSSRTEQTTLTEGTLAMASGATLDPAKLTLGTDPAKPVSLNLGGAAISAHLMACMSATVGGAAGGSVAIDNGAISDTAYLRVWNGSLTLGSNAQVTMNASVEGWVCVGGNSSDESVTTNDVYLVLDGASINKSGSKNIYLAIGDYGSYPSKAMMIVKNGGSYTPGSSAYVAQGCEGHLIIDGEGSSVSVWNVVFCNGTRCEESENGYVVVTNGGMLAVNQLDYGSGKGEGYFRFDGGTLRAKTANVTLLPAHEKLHYEVGKLGGTIDNNGKNITIAKGLSGTGTINLTGSGTTTFAEGVGAAGGVSVANGTTLAINGTAQSSFGSLALAAGSTLNIANYDGTTPVSVGALALPSEGTVNLKLNGGAFGKGIYAICAAPGVTAADGGKFAFATTDNQTATWSVAGGTLFLTVGDISGNYWTGRGGDGKMSTAANWLNGVPAAGEDIDLSLLSSATTIIADTGRAFGTVTMGGGVVTFTDSLTVAAFSDLLKVAVAAGSTVTIDGDVTLNEAGQKLCKTIAAGGMLRITGLVEISHSSGEVKAADIATSGAGAPGAIMVEGGIAVKTDASVVWNAKTLVLGADGISFTRDAPFYFTVDDPEVYSLGATTVLGTGGKGLFRTNNDDVFLCTTQYGSDQPAVITFDGNFNGSSGYWSHWRVKEGSGKVVCTSAAKSNRGLRINAGATLAFNPNTATFGQSDQTFHVLYSETASGTLEIASSGTVTLTGNLSLADGAALGFNFTDRNTPPQFALSSGNLTANGKVNVKISGDVWPKGGEKVLTTCGGFDAEGVTVSLAEGAPKWVKSVYVNEDGNIVLDVKPRGTRVIVR